LSEFTYGNLTRNTLTLGNLKLTKMIYRALPSLTQLLLSLPESGMGYQIVDPKRQDAYSVNTLLIYNGQLIVDKI